MIKRVILLLLMISLPQWILCQPPSSPFMQGHVPTPPDPRQEFKVPITGFDREDRHRHGQQVHDPFRVHNEIIQRQNQQLIDEYHHSRARQQRLIHETHRELSMSEEEREHLRDYQRYQSAWVQIVNMINTKKYNLKDAIYLVESAILPDYMSYQEYNAYINKARRTIYTAMQQEGYDHDNESAKKMMLHRYISGIIEIYDENNTLTTRTKKMEYDFDDPMGNKKIENQFVTKLIKTHKGQCHSLPLFYLIMAQELGFEAWLSIAPSHSFVKVKDKKGKLYNLELTIGHYTNDQFMMQSGYISTEAVINKTFLDTMNTEKVLHHCLSDLQTYHVDKYGYQPYLQRDIENLVSTYPNNMTAWIHLSNFATVQFDVELKRLGYPKPEDIGKHERLQSLHRWMHSIYKKIDEMGFNTIPVEKYQKWLQSFNNSNKKSLDRT